MSVAEINVAVVEVPGGAVAKRFCERVPLAVPVERRLIQLTTDSPTVVGLDGMTVASLTINTNLPEIQQAPSRVTVTLTNADVSAQSIEVDDLLELLCRSKPYTAITLTRVAGQATTVELLLGMLLAT